MRPQVAIKGFLWLAGNPEVQVLAHFLKLMYCTKVKSKRKTQRQNSPF